MHPFSISTRLILNKIVKFLIFFISNWLNQFIEELCLYLLWAIVDKSSKYVLKTIK